MEVIINTVDTEKLPGYKRLLTEEYWKIDDDQFPGVIEEVLEDVKNGRVKLLDTVKLFIYFTYFIKKGLIEYDIKTISSIFFNGMNVSALTSEYYENPDEEISSIILEEKTPEIDEILNHFYMINRALKDKMYSEKADGIFKCIPMKMEMFYERFDKECMDVPIFKYYDPYQMYQRISCASNEDIVTIKEKLLDRAEKYTKEIEPEMKNIRQLKQIIDDYVCGKEMGIKIVMLKEFAKDLGTILEKYN